MFFIKKVRAGKLKKTRSKVAQDLWFFHENKNSGLLERKLFSMLGVRSVWRREGMKCYIDVEMTDGYEIITSSVSSYKALRNAAMQVVRRLQETRLSF
jgi:hypothetical protein